MIIRRHVLFLAGFDPIDVPSQHRRFQREIAKFAATWSLGVDVSGIESATGGAGAHWRVTARGPDWTTHTVYEPLDWQDVVSAELGRSRAGQLIGGLTTFFDFVFSGTAYRYAVATWRYALFFAVPFLEMLLFTLLAIAGGALGAWTAGASGLAAAALTVAIAAGIFVVLMRWPGRRWRVEQAFADWIFAREYMDGRRKDVEARLDRFADRLIARLRAGDCDEVIVVGHSLGATFAVDVLARALARDAAAAEQGPALCLLTVGATIPKLALHPRAARLREQIRGVAEHPRIAWTEYQARRDPISFFRFDPVTLAPFVDNAPGRKPRIVIVGLKDMLAPETYQRHKLNHMRLHYQFVMGNERRAIYDYFMLIAGPAPFAFLSAVPKGALDVFGEDGAWRMRPPVEAASAGERA